MVFRNRYTVQRHLANLISVKTGEVLERDSQLALDNDLLPVKESGA